MTDKKQASQMVEESDNNHFSENNQANPFRYNLSFSVYQKRFLILSAIIPLAIFLLQIANIIFIIVNPPPGSVPQELIFPRFFDMFTPMLVMICMSVFGLVNFIFLLSWKKKVTKYNDQKQSFSKMVENQQKESDDIKFISFTELSYQNLKFLKRMRVFSFITNLISILYIGWVVMGFLVVFDVPNLPITRPPLALHILNTIA
ncbi:MAG: hypothetical protein ACTSSK_06810, partial [Candidatus Heimdallarchaeota archaeon]